MDENCPHSVFAGFVELVTFLRHVLGFECDTAAVNHPWIQGVLRSKRVSRPARKQSRPLLVAEAQSESH